MKSWRINPERECNPEIITDDTVHGYLLLFVVTMPLGMLRSVLNYFEAGGHMVKWWVTLLLFMSAFWLLYTVGAICLRSRDAVFAAKSYLYFSIIANSFSLLAALVGLLPVSPVDPFTLAAIIISIIWLIYFSRSEVVEARFPRASRRIFIADWIGVAATLILPVIAICLLPLIIMLTMRPADNFNADTAQVKAMVDGFNIHHKLPDYSLKAHRGSVTDISYNPDTNTITISQELAHGEDTAAGDDLFAASSTLFSPAFELYKIVRQQRPTFRFVIHGSSPEGTREVVIDFNQYEALHKRLFDTNHSLAYTERLDRTMPLQTGCGELWEARFDPMTVSTELRMKELTTNDPAEIASTMFDRFPSLLYHINEYDNDLVITSLDRSDNELGQWRLSRSQLKEIATRLGIYSALLPEGLNRYLRDFNNSRPVNHHYQEADLGIAPRNRGIEHTHIVYDDPEHPFNPESEAIARYRQSLETDLTSKIDYHEALTLFHLPLTIRFIGSTTGRTATITIPARPKSSN
ncbi:MAG: hypothetical protein HDS07_05855 [Bacteroides sp.]|nr:hypothetical protein [Bacteroides sp.]